MKAQSDVLDVSVVLPSYNERENIVEAIERISKAVGSNLKEIIIVDDNSPDGTWQLVEEYNHPKVRLIRRMNEKGLASALARGVEEAKGNFVVWMDCDLGLPPEDIPKLLAPLHEHDVVIGSRYVPGGKDNRTKTRAFMSTIFNLYAQLILGFYAKDYTAGFIAVKKEVTDAVPLSKEGFGEYFADFVYRAHKKGFKITEVGYEYNYRKGGTSKLDTGYARLVRFGWQYGLRILKIRFGKQS